MAAFREANQVRLKLKMQFFMYSWYNSSHVVSDSEGYAVVINVNRLNNQIRKMIPPVVDGVGVKAELE